MKVWGDVPEELTEANCCQLEPRLGKMMKAFIIYIIRNNYENILLSFLIVTRSFFSNFIISTFEYLVRKR
jgi:hypothetical protein